MQDSVHRISLLLIILTGMSCTIGPNMKISYAEAVHIADNFLRQKAFEIQNTEVVHDPKNENWIKLYLGNELFVETHDELLKSLNNKDYWAIHYVPKRTSVIVKGGGAWVFVGKETGAVIQYFLEK